MNLIELLPSIFKDNLPEAKEIYCGGQTVLFSYKGNYLIARTLMDHPYGIPFLDILMADLELLHRVICDISAEELELNLTLFFKSLVRHGLENRLTMVLLLDRFLEIPNKITCMKVLNHGKLYLEVEQSSTTVAIELESGGTYRVCDPEEYGLGSFFMTGSEMSGSFRDKVNNIQNHLEIVAQDIIEKEASGERAPFRNVDYEDI